MTAQRLLLDTVFIQGLLNRNDQYHEPARALLPRVRAAAEVWVTEAVLVEVAPEELRGRVVRSQRGSWGRAASAPDG